MCCLAASIPFLWLCPETKGKSLEEIGVIFGDRHVHVALEGGEAVEETLQAAGKQADHVDIIEHEHVEE